MSKKKLPVLRVAPFGPPAFRRFQIVNDAGEVWNGDAWEPIGGRVYAAHNAAAAESQRILKSHFEGVEPRRYIAPLVIEVFSDDAVHVAHIVRYLSHAIRLHIDTGEHGHGPRNSLVLPCIDWGQIEEVKDVAHE